MTVWFVGLLTASAPAKMRRNILFLRNATFRDAEPCQQQGQAVLIAEA